MTQEEEAMRSALEVLADIILDDEEIHPLDRYGALKGTLNTEEFHQLGLMLEICPVHITDYQICRDYEYEGCAHIWKKELP